MGSSLCTRTSPVTGARSKRKLETRSSRARKKGSSSRSLLRAWESVKGIGAMEQTNSRRGGRMEEVRWIVNESTCEFVDDFICILQV